MKISRKMVPDGQKQSGALTRWAAAFAMGLCVSQVVWAGLTVHRGGCPRERGPEPKFFSFYSERANPMHLGKACGTEIMEGYDPNFHKIPKSKYKFAYLEAFGGPTGDSTNWEDMENGEWDRTVARAAKCGIKLQKSRLGPDDRKRWLGRDGMKCLIQHMKELAAKGVTSVEIDNAGWIPKYAGKQIEFVRDFTRMMEEEGLCNMSLVMKNLSPSDFRKLSTSFEERNGINPRMISNFAIIEEMFDLRASRSALAGTHIQVLQSRDTHNYGTHGFADSGQCRGAYAPTTESGRR